MENYWDCSLCRVEPKGEAARCRSCRGRLKGRDRLVEELVRTRKARFWAAALSAVAGGLGQVYLNRKTTGILLGILLPLGIGLVMVTWEGFTYGHVFIVGIALFVLCVGVADALWGPTGPSAPCQRTCPAALDIPDYLQLLKDKNYEQGYELIRTRLPLVGSIGRVCPHPCEAKCYRGVDGEPIAINGCKRFLADKYLENTMLADYPQPGLDVPSVGVVGGGPTGMACAFYLSILGARVTVFDSAERAGGRLTYSIPDFRLPPEVVGQEVEDLRRRGVGFELGVRIGPGGRGLGEVAAAHDAIFLCTGAEKSISPDFWGAELAQDFQEVLIDAKRGGSMLRGKRVGVLGGGNAAMDVCRTIIRQGATEVHLIYRRGPDEMPARSDEVAEATKEGVNFHFLVDPVRALVKNDTLVGLELVRMKLGAPDSSGRPRPEPIPLSEWTLKLDAVVPALGQTVKGSIFDDPMLSTLKRDGWGRVEVELATGKTSVPKVYAGGDVVTGPTSAVRAIADGRRGAMGIYWDLCGKTLKAKPLKDKIVRHPFPGHVETPQQKIREDMPQLSVRSRQGSFCEVEEGFADRNADREARRCLQCHREI